MCHSTRRFVKKNLANWLLNFMILFRRDDGKNVKIIYGNCTFLGLYLRSFDEKRIEEHPMAIHCMELL